MGALPKPEKKEIPNDVEYLYQAYRDMKFSRVPKDDSILLVPRDDLSFESVREYGDISGLNFECWEISALMSIDGVFNYFRAG